MLSSQVFSLLSSRQASLCGSDHLRAHVALLPWHTGRAVCAALPTRKRRRLPGPEVARWRWSGGARAAAAQVAQQEAQVQVRTTREVAFGDTVRIVGEGPLLGNWDAASGPELRWGEGHEWAASLLLPPGSYEFKCIVVHADGSIAEWEGGPNRNFQVEPDRQSVEVVCPWSETELTVTQPTTEAPAAELAVEGPAETVDGIGNGAPEGVAELTLPSAAGEEESQVTGANGSSVDADQGGLEVLAADPVADTVDLADRIVDTSALAGPNSAGSQADDTAVQDGVEPPLPSAQASAGPAAIPTPSLPQTPSANAPELPLPDQAQKVAQEGLQGQEAERPRSIPAWLLAPVALAAVPVVLWSEYTLKSTGCGLPPGPGGALGAAEGISYLAVAAVAFWSLVSALQSMSGSPPPGDASSPGWRTAALGSVYATIAAGLVVLGFQVKDYGYIPGALPDSHCHSQPGTGSTLQVSAAPAVRNKESVGRELASFTSASSNRFPGLASNGPRMSVVAGLQQASRDVAEGMESVAGSMQEAGSGIMENFRGFMNLQQEQLEQARSGALDGLSSADVTAVVDELQAAAGRIKDLLVDRLSGVMKGATGASPAWLRHPPAPVAVVPIGAKHNHRMPLAALPLPRFVLADAGPLVSQRGEEGASEGSRTQGEGPHIPRWMSPGDMSFMAAATNAVSAANNVNTHLNTVAAELQHSVDNVRAVIADAKDVARMDAQVDVAQLATTMASLEQALGAAQEQASNLDLQPLASQLRSAALRLRQSANGSAETVNPIAARLDTAAGDLVQAAAAANHADIKATREHLASLTAEPLPKPAMSSADSSPAASFPESSEATETATSESAASPASQPAGAVAEAVQPAVQQARDVAGKLQEAVNNIREAEPVLGQLDRGLQASLRQARPAEPDITAANPDGNVSSST